MKSELFTECEKTKKKKGPEGVGGRRKTWI